MEPARPTDRGPLGPTSTRSVSVDRPTPTRGGHDMSTTLMRWRSLAWVLPALVLLLVFVYYPIVDNLRLSLFSWNAFSVAPTFVGLDNYRTAFHDPIFWTALRNNTVFAIVSLVCQVGVSLVLAALLEEFV